jgi:hypothetical protein
MRIYLTNKQTLAYFQQFATHYFWNRHWQIDDLCRLKVCLGASPRRTTAEPEEWGDIFYQFTLLLEQVQYDLERLGFRLVEHLTYDGIKGFKDKVTWLKPWLQPIYNRKRDHRLRPYLDKWLKPSASHCSLLLMQKTSEVEGQ